MGTSGGGPGRGPGSGSGWTPPSRPVAVYHGDLIIAEAIAAALRVTHTAGSTVAADRLETLLRSSTPPAVIAMVSAAPGEVADVCEALGYRRLVVPVLTSRENLTAESVVADLLDGAAGAVHLAASTRRFGAAVRAVMAGGLTIPVGVRPAAVGLLVQVAGENSRARRRLAGMTPREREVLGLMASGHGHIEVAARLGVAVTTARTHADRVRIKLEAASLLQATIEARRTLRLGTAHQRPVEALFAADRVFAGRQGTTATPGPATGLRGR